MDIRKLVNLIELYNNLNLENIVELYKTDIKYITTKKSAKINNIDIINCERLNIKVPKIKYRYILDSTKEELKYRDINIGHLLELEERGKVIKVPLKADYRDIEVYNIQYIDTERYEVNLENTLNTLNITKLEELLNILTNDKGIVRYILKEMFNKTKRYVEVSNEINEGNIDYICNSLIIALDFIDRVCKRPKILDIKYEDTERSIEDMLCCLESMKIRKLTGDRG